MVFGRQRLLWDSDASAESPAFRLVADTPDAVFGAWFVVNLHQARDRVRVRLETSPDGVHWMQVASSTGRFLTPPRAELVPVMRGLGRFVRAVSVGSQPRRVQVWLASNRGFALKGNV